MIIEVFLLDRCMGELIVYLLIIPRTQMFLMEHVPSCQGNVFCVYYRHFYYRIISFLQNTELFAVSMTRTAVWSRRRSVGLSHRDRCVWGSRWASCQSSRDLERAAHCPTVQQWLVNHIYWNFRLIIQMLKSFHLN